MNSMKSFFKRVNRHTLWRNTGMILLLVVFFVSPLSGMAQGPLLKTVEVPAAGTPPLRTEGLLTSQWAQDYPYNVFCPRDPVNDYALSYAGCPAVAMGQVINYWRTTQGTRFTDNDDYHHNYAGRNYYIDDDWEALQFPRFRS